MALDSLDEIREKAREAFQAYQERIKRHYDKLVKPRMFTVGDLVHAPLTAALSGGLYWKGSHLLLSCHS
jgi:hypothetical protein